MLLPNQAGAHAQELVQVGKEGTIYVIDRNQMTTNNQHYCSGCASDTQIAQELQSEVGPIFSTPAYWNGNLYFWGIFDNLVAFRVTSGQLALAQVPQAEPFLDFPARHRPFPRMGLRAESFGPLTRHSTDNRLTRPRDLRCYTPTTPPTW